MRKSDTVYTSTLIGYAPHALSLEETRAVTITPVDFSGTLGTTVNTIGGDFSTFITSVWPFVLGVILLILFLILAVRLSTGAFKRMTGLGRSA